MFKQTKKAQASRIYKPHQKQAKKTFAQKHLIAASFAGLAFVIASTLYTSEQAEAKRSIVELELPSQAINELTLDDSAIESQLEWLEQTVKSGDNLSSVFSRAGISTSAMYELLNTCKESKSLRTLRPGDKLRFASQDSQFVELQHIPSKLITNHYSRTDSGFEYQKHQKQPQIRQRYVEATLESSLFIAAQEAGMPSALIMNLTDIFGGVIDFVYDPRSGDTFSLVYEEKYIDGEKLGHGKILAATYVNEGEEFTAYRYVDSQGDAGYYSAEGVSMQKAFLRSPVDFTRISSGFNPSRLHPVFKTRRPHRGIDYAAPTGTPVFAAGAGRVTAAGYSKANGNYVIIQHGSGRYVTKYLHLHKRHVRKGQKISQRQVIGTVGSTGYATGPHLHYEFLVDGSHRNPRTILKKLPKAKSLSNKEKQQFVAAVEVLDLQLNTYQQRQQLALLEEQ